MKNSEILLENLREKIRRTYKENTRKFQENFKIIKILKQLKKQEKNRKKKKKK